DDEKARVADLGRATELDSRSPAPQRPDVPAPGDSQPPLPRARAGRDLSLGAGPSSGSRSAVGDDRLGEQPRTLRAGSVPDCRGSSGRLRAEREQNSSRARLGAPRAFPLVANRWHFLGLVVRGGPRQPLRAPWRALPLRARRDDVEPAL